jgi:RNA chaperone ProQ/FINO-like protein
MSQALSTSFDHARQERRSTLTLKAAGAARDALVKRDPDAVRSIERSAPQRRAERERRRKSSIYRTRLWLRHLYPACFAGLGADKQPLKIGILHDILASQPTAHRGIVCDALSDYTGGARYFMAMSEGAVRIDLNGEPAGIVTADEAAFAAQRLASITPQRRDA